MSKTRDTTLPQHDYIQGHYGELPITAFPSGSVGQVLSLDSGSVFVWTNTVSGSTVTASEVSYSNSTSGLSATDVQDAIDALAAGGTPTTCSVC